MLYISEFQALQESDHFRAEKFDVGKKMAIPGPQMNPFFNTGTFIYIAVWEGRLVATSNFHCKRNFSSSISGGVKSKEKVV
jgi:hypothetical protein